MSKHLQDKSMKKDIDIKIIKTISKKIENAKNNLIYLIVNIS